MRHTLEPSLPLLPLCLKASKLQIPRKMKPLIPLQTMAVEAEAPLGHVRVRAWKSDEDSVYTAARAFIDMTLRYAHGSLFGRTCVRFAWLTFAFLCPHGPRITLVLCIELMDNVLAPSPHRILDATRTFLHLAMRVRTSTGVCWWSENLHGGWSLRAPSSLAP